jgi:hypothetical protein
MSKIVTLTNPNDIKVVNGWLAETRLRSLRTILFGSAAMVAAAGLGIAGCIWAWGQRGPSPEQLAAALAKMPPLTVKGTVGIDPKAEVALRDGGEVSLKDGAQVALRSGGEVSLAKGGKVAVEGAVGVDPNAKIGVTGALPLPTVNNQPAMTVDGDAIKREVTVFSSVTYLDGQVETGWIYPGGSAKAPKSQYCYYMSPNPDGSSYKVDIAREGQPIAAARPLVNDFDGAVDRCVWWKQGA